MQLKQQYRRPCALLCLLAITLGAGLAFQQPTAPAPRPVRIAKPQPPRKPDIAPRAERAAPVVPERPKDFVTFPATPTFADMGEGRFEAHAAGYRAIVSADNGLIYHANDRQTGARQGKLHVRLRTVTRGAETLFDRDAQRADADAEDTPIENDDDGVSFWRGDFEERYTPRGDGVEQLFIFEDEPDGTGDLAFTCDLGMTGLIPLPARANVRGGISFSDRKGGFIVRYGQIVVRDSAQNGIVLEPRLENNGRSIAFTVPQTFLDKAVYPLLVDPLVGADFPLSPDNPFGIAQPTVAAGNNNFLVAWNDYGAGEQFPQILASIVTGSGIPSQPFAISNAIGLPRDFRNQRIEAAFDGSNWLVVWSDDRPNGPGIRGSIISSSGAVLGGSDFLIAGTSGLVQEDPLVAFNGVDFFVAWQNTPPGATGGSQVYYARVTSSAVIDAAQVLPSGTETISQALLFLAPQKPSGDTLVIYRDINEAPVQTRAVRVGLNGALRDLGGLSLFKQDLPDGGFGQPIGANFFNGEWHVLSSLNQLTDSSVYLHKVDINGVVTPPSGIFAEVGLGPIGLTTEQFAPAFAGANEWLFLRNEKVSGTVHHLLGKRVSFTGEDKDPVMFQVDTATQGILRNAVAAQSGNVFLAAWLDGRRGGSQPGDSRNIFAALIDVTAAGEAGTALIARAGASPTSGEAPLSVAFDSTASTGSFDTISWDFGDGTVATEAAVTHVYKTKGTFLAQLKLTKGPYSVFDTVLINVGGGTPTGPGGGQQIGIPIENSPGLVSEIFISGMVVKLNFAEEKKDMFRVAGKLDIGRLPDSLTGVPASVSFGGMTKTFNLDAKGEFKSDPGVFPFTRFTVVPATGDFALEVINDDLRSTLDALGAKNETVKPAKNITVPITVTIGSFSTSASVAVAYRATKDTAGEGLYFFLKEGAEVSGSFLVSKFSASQQTRKENGEKIHNYSIKGQCLRPNGGLFKPSTSGEFRIIIGNFSIGIPGGQFRTDGGKTKFVARTGITGLKKFSMDLNSGVFNLQMVKVPAEGNGGSGLPLANSGGNIVKVDLNLSFVLDLDDNTRISAGRYMFIGRKDSAAKNWKQR